MQAKDETTALWGRNLQARREACGFTQEQVGEQLTPPVRQGTIARWEQGVHEPRKEYRAQLASVLRTEANLIFPLPAVA